MSTLSFRKDSNDSAVTSNEMQKGSKERSGESNRKDNQDKTETRDRNSLVRLCAHTCMIIMELIHIRWARSIKKFHAHLLSALT